MPVRVSRRTFNYPGLSDPRDDALDESVEVFGAVDDWLPRNESHHYPVDECQRGDCLIFDQSRIRRGVGGMPLSDNLAGERVEPVPGLVEGRGEFRVAAGEQHELVAGPGAGQPGFAVDIHDNAGQARGSGELC